MVSAAFSRVFAAAHRVWNDEGKCHNIHGHNYHVDVRLDIVDGFLNDQGFVVPFDVIKTVIDRYDHALILDVADPLREREGFDTVMDGLAIQYVDGPPSTELMAALLAQTLAVEVPAANPNLQHVAITVGLRETAGIYAEATAQGRG